MGGGTVVLSPYDASPSIPGSKKTSDLFDKVAEKLHTIATASTAAKRTDFPIATKVKKKEALQQCEQETAIVYIQTLPFIRLARNISRMQLIYYLPMKLGEHRLVELQARASWQGAAAIYTFSQQLLTGTCTEHG